MTTWPRRGPATAASVYESEKRSVKKGRSAGKAPLGEVGSEMPGGERGHRPPVDPDAHRPDLPLASRRDASRGETRGRCRWRRPRRPRRRGRRPARRLPTRACAELIASGEAGTGFGETALVTRERHPPRRRGAGPARGRGLDPHALSEAPPTRRGGSAARSPTSSIRLFRVTAEDQARAAADGLVLSTYDTRQWRSQTPDDRKPFERLVLVGADDGAVAAGARAARVAEWANRARDLSNAPPNELTPERLAERAAELAPDSVAVEALDLARIEELSMGALAGVGQGAHNEPRLIVMRYEPDGAKGDVTLGLVGKAITFDTGGISLKPSLRHGEHEGRHVGRRRGRRGDLRGRRPADPVARARRRRRGREHARRPRRIARGTFSRRRTARRSRSPTPMPRDASFSPTRSGTRASRAPRTSWISPR